MNRNSRYLSLAIGLPVLLMLLGLPLVRFYREDFTVFVMILAGFGLSFAIVMVRRKHFEERGKEMIARSKDRGFRLFLFAFVLPVVVGFSLVNIVPSLRTPTVDHILHPVVLLLAFGFYIFTKRPLAKKQERSDAESAGRNESKDGGLSA